MLKKGYYKLKSGFRKYELSCNNKNIIADNDLKSFDKYLREIGMEDYVNKKRLLRQGVEIF